MKVPNCCVVEGCRRPVFVGAPFVQALVHVATLGDHEVELRLCRECRDALVNGVVRSGTVSVGRDEIGA